MLFFENKQSTAAWLSSTNDLQNVYTVLGGSQREEKLDSSAGPLDSQLRTRTPQYLLCLNSNVSRFKFVEKKHHVLASGWRLVVISEEKGANVVVHPNLFSSKASGSRQLLSGSTTDNK